jgi:hypothetical protein
MLPDGVTRTLKCIRPRQALQPAIDGAGPSQAGKRPVLGDFTRPGVRRPAHPPRNGARRGAGAVSTLTRSGTPRVTA